MQVALDDLRTSLRRIHALADEISKNAARALADAAVRNVHETQQCGAIVLLTGYFEAFLRDVVRSFADQLSASGTDFASLPDAMRNHHYEGGGRVLAAASMAFRKRKTTSFGGASREDILARLHSPLATPGACTILWEAFADTKANPRPEVVKEIGERLGIKNFWPSVAAKCGNVAFASGSALAARLDDLVAKRNECAHTGRVSPIPTAHEVSEFADMLETVGVGIVAVLEAQLAKFGPP